MTPPPGILSLPNGQWVLEHDSHLSRWAEQHGTIVSDPHLMKWLKPRIPAGAVVFDIGANIGDHTRQYLDWGHEVVAIEPHPLAYACLAHNCPEARCLNVAASAAAGSLNFMALDNAGASRIHKDGEWSVEAVRLDDMGLPAPGFVKIDVEGHEPLALIGMEDTIAKHKPIVFIEINQGALATNGSSREDVVMFFATLGYRRFEIYPPDAKETDPQFDYLITP